MNDASNAGSIHTNIMDTWLVENEHLVRVNLGESNVADLHLGEVFPPTELARELGGITLGNNSTWGSDRLREAVAATYPGTAPDHVLVTAGVSEAIVAVCLAHYVRGANFVIPTPAFHALIDVPEKLGYEIRKVPLQHESNFRLAVDAVVAAIDGRTRIVLLNSPHNPTGAVYAREDILRIADAAADAGAIVVVDEHYRYLPHDASVPWLASAAGARENIVAFGSVGKCFGCTGLRVGWILAHPRWLERHHHHKLLVTHTIPLLSDRIAAQLLEHRDERLPAIKDGILQNLRRLTRAAAGSDGALVLQPPDAGSVAFVRLPGIPDSFAFAQALLENTGVLVLPGESFELPGFLRIRLGVASAAFDEACGKLEAFLRAYRAAGQYVAA